MRNVEVFRSAFLWEIDRAKDALKEESIPHFAREETFSGFNQAFPASPSAGPGVTWCVLVPESAVDDAKRVLRDLSLDVDNQPSYWDFNSHPRVRLGLRIWAWGMLITMAIIFIEEIFKLL
jgi:hypothetical protein